MYRIFTNSFSCLVFLIASSVSMKGQQGNFKNYSVNDGLAQSQIYSITESAEGYLWLGTRGGGLCRFDGIKFETFTKKDGLPSNYINNIYLSNNKDLWIATNNGICLYSNDKFKSFPLDANVLTIMEDRNDRMWIGTDQGLFYRNNNQFEKYELSKTKLNQEVNCIIKDSNDGIWIGTNRGLIHLNNDKIQKYTTKEGLSTNYILSLVLDNYKQLWIGTYGKGISILTPQGITTAKPLKELNNSIIYSLLNDNKGNTWIATLEKGLIKWNASDSILTYFNENDGLANNHVRSIYDDSWNNLWIGTSGGGISKFSGQHFDLYNSSSSKIKSNYIYAIEAVNDTDIWISTSGRGVNRFLNNKTFYYGSDSGFVDSKVKVIRHTTNNDIWFGTDGKGLYLFDGDTFITSNFNKNIGSVWIKDIKEDQNQNIWIATSGGGISKISIDRSDSVNRYSYLRFTRSNGLLSNRINQLHIDKENKVWFAYQSGGLGYIEKDSIIYHISSKEAINKSPIRTIVEDPFNNLWLGTGGKGLYRVQPYEDSLAFTNFSSDQLLSSDNIYLLDIDLQSNLWVGSEKGVEKIKLDSDGNLLEATNFGIDEGFKGVETSKNAITVDNRGSVWIGTINGLFRYNAHYKSNNKKAPVLNINDLSLFYKSIKETVYAKYLSERKKNKLTTIILESDQNHLTFDFKGLLLTKPNQVNYKWKLDGLESTWSPVTKKNSITYSNLNPGNYLFKVSSSNEDGIWNEHPETIAFEIRSPFWEKTWFIVSCILFIILLLILIFWLRIRTINKKADATQHLLKMENDVLVLEQKALQLQMNPHFIFNCLNSIQSMIVKKDHKTARYFLAKFSKLIRKTLDNSREQLILLDDEIETLDNYLSIEKFCNEDHFDYEINVSKEISSDFLQIPPMLIQPFVENAIVHGVMHKRSNGKITIDFSISNNLLICTIEDNGIGRQQASKINQKRFPDHKSTALLVTQERLAYIGKETTTDQLIIKDLVNNKQKPCGTKVIIKIKIED